MKKIVKILICTLLIAVSAVGFGACVTENGDDFNRNRDILLVQREAGSGTRSAFEELLGKITVHSSAGEYSSTGALRTAVSVSPYSIGYVSAASVNDSVKALKIDGVEPTPEKIKSGEYILQRPFMMITKKSLALTDMTAAAQDFYKYVFSTQGQNIVKGDGLVEVATSDTEAYVAPATALTGGVVVMGSTSVQPVMEKIIEAYKLLNSGVNITLGGTGSTQGKTEADKGETNLFGIISADFSETESAKYNGYTLAKDGIAVIVNSRNPLNELTKQQIVDIFVGTKSGTDKWSYVIAA